MSRIEVEKEIEKTRQEDAMYKTVINNLIQKLNESDSGIITVNEFNGDNWERKIIVMTPEIHDSFKAVEKAANELMNAKELYSDKK